jgi:hypothetical protein
MARWRNPRQHLLQLLSRPDLDEFVCVDRENPVRVAGRKHVSHQSIHERALIERGSLVTRHKNAASFRCQRSKDLGSAVGGPVIDNRETVEHGQIVANECLDNVRGIADCGGSNKAHGRGGIEPGSPNAAFLCAHGNPELAATAPVSNPESIS